jgi:hypothetical protein
MLLEHEQDTCQLANYSDVSHRRDRRAMCDTKEV